MKIINPYEPPGIGQRFVEWLRGLLRRVQRDEHELHRSALPARGKVSANTAMNKHAAPIIAAILLLLPVMYVGSYLALVSPQGVTTPDLSDPYNYEGWIKNYRVGDSLCKQLFWPLEQIDRQLRPGAWDERQQLENALKSYRHAGNLPEFSK